MAKHPAHHRLTATPKRSGLDDNPLRMLRWHVVGEAADFSLLVVHQPTDTVLRCVSVDKWPVLVGHQWSLATTLIEAGRFCEDPDVCRR